MIYPARATLNPVFTESNRCLHSTMISDQSCFKDSQQIISGQIVLNRRDGNIALRQGADIRLHIISGRQRCAGNPIINIIPRIRAFFKRFDNIHLALADDNDSFDFSFRQTGNIHVNGAALQNCVC